MIQPLFSFYLCHSICSTRQSLSHFIHQAMGFVVGAVLFLLSGATALAQIPDFPEVDSLGEPIHQVTLFVIPTMHPFDWSSPGKLYKTVSRCFYKTIGLDDNYLLGHMAIGLHTPLLGKPRYLTMTSANKSQSIELILKKKVGLSILGASLEGKIESEEHLLHMFRVYAKRRKLAYITVRVHEAAMKQILDFVNEFSQQRPGEHHPSDYYGGAYWPFYKGEGAGCSAFSLGLMAAAGVMPPAADTCLIKVKIPMALIGGEFNQNQKVHYHQILKTKEWYNGNGVPNVDFVTYQVYEPSILFDWIFNKRMQPDSVYQLTEQDGTPGLKMDFRQKNLPLQKPFFVQRPNPNLFIDVYRQKVWSKFPETAF
jgi:hypothetical protein